MTRELYLNSVTSRISTLCIMGNLLGTIKVGTLVKREDIQSARSRPKRALTASRPLPALDDIDDDLLPFV